MRGLVAFAVSLMVVFVACSSTGHNDGKTISERILKVPNADSMAISNAVSQLDTLITPEIFGRDFAIVLVALTESDTVIECKELYQRVKLLKNIFAEKKGVKTFNRFNEGVQSYIDGLTVERKMRVYAKIATPKQLGTALRIDRYRNPDDSIAIKEQVQILRNIYNDDEFSSFLKYFNR